MPRAMTGSTDQPPGHTAMTARPVRTAATARLPDAAMAGQRGGRPQQADQRAGRPGSGRGRGPGGRRARGGTRRRRRAARPAPSAGRIWRRRPGHVPHILAMAAPIPSCSPRSTSTTARTCPCGTGCPPPPTGCCPPSWPPRPAGARPPATGTHGRCDHSCPRLTDRQARRPRRSPVCPASASYRGSPGARAGADACRWAARIWWGSAPPSGWGSA